MLWKDSFKHPKFKICIVPNCRNNCICTEILDGPLNVEINTYIRELGPILPQDNVSETKLSLTYNFTNSPDFIAEYNAKGAKSVDI